MRRLIACVLALVSLQGVATGRTICGVPGVLAAPFPKADAAEQGLAIALQGRTLAVWPQEASTEINTDAGMVLYFRDGDPCEVAITGPLVHGLRLALPTDTLQSIEAAICDAQAGMCVPIRIALSGDRKPAR